MSSRIKGPKPRNGANSRNGESSREATALRDAMLRAASERGHSFIATARFLSISDVHWNRLRRHPQHLGRCDRALLQRIAKYVGWPLLLVYVAAGILGWSDVSAALSAGNDLVQDALLQIARTQLGAAVRTPLNEAAADHQMLIALLFLGVQQTQVWNALRVLEG